MGTKRSPGKYDCYQNAQPDEPMFVLLGRDRHAPALVRRWAAMREAEDEDPARVAEARRCAGEMEKWRGRIAVVDALAAAMRGVMAAQAALDAGDLPAARRMLVSTADDAGQVLVAARRPKVPPPTDPCPPPPPPVREDRTYCHADDDGDCTWSGCPQRRDGEPARSKRSCPFDVLDE